MSSPAESIGLFWFRSSKQATATNPQTAMEFSKNILSRRRSVAPQLTVVAPFGWF